MNQTIREYSLETEIERLREELNKKLEGTSLSDDNILCISQKLDILITQYTKKDI